MKFLKPLGLMAMLAACTTVTPNDYRANYGNTYQQRSAASVGSVQVVDHSASQSQVPRSEGGMIQPVQTTQLTPVAPDQTLTVKTSHSVAISDEQNFEAVSQRETIESDAARLAANRQKYMVIQPTQLPTRQDQRPNIVEYALQTNNPVGATLYKRGNLFGFNRANKTARNCAQYASSDLAQQDFLARGGPVRDRLALDPDGDGFACKWDPRPFRSIRSNG